MGPKIYRKMQQQLWKHTEMKNRLVDQLQDFSNSCTNRYHQLEPYKSSFFPQTVGDWNELPDSLISSTENSADCVSKFASLVRARD